MTNLEVINRYLYRAWKSKRLNCKLHRTMWSSGNVSPLEAHELIKDYLNLSTERQLLRWSDCNRAITNQIKIINTTLDPIVKNIFSKAFEQFLREENIYGNFIQYAFSEDAQNWRMLQYGDDIKMDNLTDYLNQCPPMYYVYRAWLWRAVPSFNGSEINHKWFNKIHKILLEDFSL